jgi:hypothetical protein
MTHTWQGESELVKLWEKVEGGGRWEEVGESWGGHLARGKRAGKVWMADEEVRVRERQLAAPEGGEGILLNLRKLQLQVPAMCTVGHEHGLSQNTRECHCVWGLTVRCEVLKGAAHGSVRGSNPARIMSRSVDARCCASRSSSLLVISCFCTSRPSLVLLMSRSLAASLRCNSRMSSWSSALRSAAATQRRGDGPSAARRLHGGEGPAPDAAHSNVGIAAERGEVGIARERLGGRWTHKLRARTCYLEKRDQVDIEPHSLRLVPGADHLAERGRSERR